MLSKSQLFLLALVLSIFNWLMTFLGSSLVYFVKSKSQKLVSIALGLAAGIMIAATFFSLLLPAIQQVEDHLLLLFLIPLVFFSGGLFLRLCDKLLWSIWLRWTSILQIHQLATEKWPILRKGIFKRE